MKVKNDYILIKNGKQQIKIRNMILDKYIKNIVDYQFKTDGRTALNMTAVFLKFDSELDFDEHSNLSKNNFDVGVEISLFNFPKVEMSSKEIINNYIYTFYEGKIAVDIKKGEAINSFKEYHGRKITAIGFSYYLDGTIYACVDTRNYNLYFDATQVFSIARRDILSTDGYIYSTNELVREPIHLCCYKKVMEKKNISYYSAILKSIGLGNNPFKMTEEHTLIPYKDHVQANTDSIFIDDELTIEKKSEGLFPEENLYPSINLHPARIIIDNLYPSNNIYPGIDVYPVYSAYQYVQLKYEIYKSSNRIAYTDTGGYYLLSMPIGNKEKIKLNILYQRA